MAIDTQENLTSYSTVVFVSGGAGQGDLDLGASRAKVIELFKTRNPSFLTLSLPQFTPVPQQSTYTPLHISSHYALAVKVSLSRGLP